MVNTCSVQFLKAPKLSIGTAIHMRHLSLHPKFQFQFEDVLDSTQCTAALRSHELHLTLCCKGLVHVTHFSLQPHSTQFCN
jgi:hypothetical protein